MKELSADVLVIGAGPAGIVVSDCLVRAGATVVLAESGELEEDAGAEELNDGRANGPILKGYPGYLRQGRRRQVGGSTSIWGPGWCMPFRDLDFEHRPWVEMSGWPFRRSELLPYEQHAAATLGIDPFAEPESDNPLLQLTYRFPPNPQVFRAMFFDNLHNRTGAGFQAELDATAIGFEASDGHIRAVRFARRAGGEELRVEAGTVVLACGGIENARLLLQHERSLAPAGEHVGACFMEHPHVFVGVARCDDPEELAGYLQHKTSCDVLALDDRSLREERLLCATVQVRPFIGSLGDFGEFEYELYLRTEQAPNPDSRLALGDELDRFGNPLPVLEWRLLEEDWTNVVRTAELLASGLEWWHGIETYVLIDRKGPWPWLPGGPMQHHWVSSWGNHHLGTTRMADSPADGVVDRDCLVHGTDNLYVAGSSVFPTGSHANPTFTIVALAHRLAEHLVANR